MCISPVDTLNKQTNATAVAAACKAPCENRSPSELELRRRIANVLINTSRRPLLGNRRALSLLSLTFGKQRNNRTLGSLDQSVHRCGKRFATKGRDAFSASDLHVLEDMLLVAEGPAALLGKVRIRLGRRSRASVALDDDLHGIPALEMFP
uniref:Uncharacterized protein n=1 Tax=Trichuris muris TaxID=70415 RepID=A0A5S6QJX5_TRIMR